MTKRLNGEILIEVDEENNPKSIVYSKPSVVRNLRSYMNARFKEDRFIGAQWTFTEEYYKDKERKTRKNANNRSDKEVKELIELYLLYSESKKRRFTLNRDNGKNAYQPIQGWSFLIMVDHHLDDKGLKRFAAQYVKSLSGGERLGYVLFEHSSGEYGRYIYLWICDYEFLGVPREIQLKYKNSMYRNKRTLSLCSKSDEDAECIHKVGDYQLDKSGNIKTKTVWFASRKAASLDYPESKMFHIARQCVVETYKSIKAKQKPAWRFRRFGIYHNQKIKYQKCLLEMNRTQYKMERIFSQLLENEWILDNRSVDYPNIYWNGDNEENMPYKLTSRGRELKQIFYHYQNGAFSKDTKLHFTDEYQNKVPLVDTRLGRDRLFNNIHYLWNRFKNEIEVFVKKHSLKMPLLLE